MGAKMALSGVSVACKYMLQNTRKNNVPARAGLGAMANATKAYCKLLLDAVWRGAACANVGGNGCHGVERRA